MRMPDWRRYSGAGCKVTGVDADCVAGHRLGSLCYIDTKPRSLHAAQAAILGNMAEMVGGRSIWLAMLPVLSDAAGSEGSSDDFAVWTGVQTYSKSME